MKQIHLRIDKVDTHAHMTLFVDGKNCGKLCMSPQESIKFGNVLRHGAYSQIPTDKPIKITGPIPI